MSEGCWSAPECWDTYPEDAPIANEVDHAYTIGDATAQDSQEASGSGTLPASQENSAEATTGRLAVHLSGHGS